MLESYFVDECTIMSSPTRNGYGDYIEGVGVVESCRWRDITTERRSTNQEIIDADAMVWLKPTTTATVGCIILHDGIHYQVERFTKAKRLGESVVQFVKCDLKITDIGVS